MFFRIEGIQPMWGEELRAALEERRDYWARVTPQSATDPDIVEADERILEARRNASHQDNRPGRGVDGAEVLRNVIQMRRDLIEVQNRTPGPEMVGALAMITEGIDHAVKLSNYYACPVRATIEGEFNAIPTRITGGYKRIAVKVDDASLG